MAEGIPGQQRATLGTDKSYDTRDFVHKLRELRVTPHVAQHTSGRSSAIDAHATHHPGYAVSQRKRQCFEEILRWMKTVGLLRKTRHRGGRPGGLDVHLCGRCSQLGADAYAGPPPLPRAGSWRRAPVPLLSPKSVRSAAVETVVAAPGRRPPLPRLPDVRHPFHVRRMPPNRVLYPHRSRAVNLEKAGHVGRVRGPPHRMMEAICPVCGCLASATTLIIRLAPRKSGFPAASSSRARSTMTTKTLGPWNGSLSTGCRRQGAGSCR